MKIKNCLIFFLLCLSIGYAIPEYSPDYLSQYLVHGYHFNSSGNYTDIAGHANVIPTNAKFQGFKPDMNESFTTDGNGYLTIPNYIAQNATAFTYLFWLNKTAASNQQMIISRDQWGAANCGLIVFSNVGKLSMKVNDGTQRDYASYGAGGVYHFAIVYATGNLTLFQNGSVVMAYSAADVPAISYGSTCGRMTIGFNIYGGDKNGIDDFLYFNKTLNKEEINAIFNGTGAGSPTSVDQLNISNARPLNSSSLGKNTVNINATIASKYNFSCAYYINDTLNTTLYYSNTSTFTNLSIIFRSYGDYNYTLICENNETSDNISSRFSINATTPLLNFSNYKIYGGANYTRNLTYTINITNCDSNNTIIRYINNTYESNETIVCTSTNYSLTRNYSYTTEGYFNISFNILNEKGILKHNYSFANYTFISDLHKPAILNFTYLTHSGFTKLQPWINLSGACNDSIYNQTEMNLTLGNGLSQLIGNYSLNKLVSYNTTALDGSFFVGLRCSDLFSTTSYNETLDIYARRVCLINEQTGNYFVSPPADASNLTKAILYNDDNQSNWSFKIDNHQCINYSSLTQNKLRIELGYLNGEVITRYIDTTLSNGTLRLCANPDPTTHYEQIIISALQKPVSLRNVYANCIIAEDYTRFTYQNNNILRAYSIPKQYYLYTYDNDGNKIYLASMDGAVSSYYNLDVLEFNQDSTTFDVAGDGVSFSQSTNAVTIRYYNLDNDSIRTNVKINRVNDSFLYFDVNETSSPNNFIVIFDYATLNLSNSSLLRITVTSTKTDGTTSEIKKYFNTQGDNGQIPNEMGFIIAILITIFGLTITAARVSLGWFGIATQLLSIIMLAFTTGAWYVTLLLGVNFIILIYIVLLFVNQNYAAVT